MGSNRFASDIGTLGPNLPSIGVGIKTSWMRSPWSGKRRSSFS